MEDVSMALRMVAACVKTVKEGGTNAFDTIPLQRTAAETKV
jgi:hypothetical protein